MVDIFAKEGITPTRDIFAEEGIDPSNLPAPEPIQDDSVMAYTESVANEYESLASTRYSPEHIQSIKDKGPIGFWEARRRLRPEEVVPAGGAIQGAEALFLANISKKVLSGESLSDLEEGTLDAFIDREIESGLRGYSTGGKIMRTLAPMPAFAIEFMATGGVGKAAQVVTTQALKGKVKNELLTKTAGVTANVLARSAAMPTPYIAKYGERRLNDYMAITDKGEAIYKESEESPAKSALMAFGHHAAEVGSEVSGVAVGKYVVQPITGAASRYLRTPVMSGINKLPASVRAGLYEAYKAINPNARVAKMFSAAGWNGVLEEMGEERISSILQGLVDLTGEEDYTFEDYLNAITPTGEQLLVEAAVMSIAGGVKGSANIATNLLTEKIGDRAKAQELVDNMSTTEQEAFINEELSVAPIPTPQVAPSDPVSQSQLTAADAADPPSIDNNESTMDRLLRDWDDDMRPIKLLVAEAEQAGADVTVGTDAYKLARQFRKIGGMAEVVLNHNTYRLDENGTGVVTGKSMRGVLSDFDASVAHVETNRDQRLKDFDDYLIARRINEDLIPNPDIEVSKKDENMAEQTMRFLSDKYGEEMRWFQVFSDEFYDFKRRVMEDFLVSEGVITQERADELFGTHARHVPFERIFEENEELDQWMPSQFTKAGSGGIIRKMFGGSEREIKSPTKAIMRQTMKIVATAHRNRVARNVARMADFVPHLVQKVATPMRKIVVTDPDTGKEIETFRPSGRAPKNTITVYEEGKPQYYELSKPLLQAMEGMPQNDLAGIWKALQIISGAPILTAAATRYNPDFVFKNIVRDQLQATVLSKARPVPFVDLSKGIASTLGKDEYYQQWLMSGGKMSSFMDLSDNAMEKALRDVMNDKSSKLKYMNPLNIISDAVDFSEKATRLGVFIKAKEQGMTDIDASLESLGASVDFTRGGRVSKVANKFIPFFNAGVQGTTKFVRAFKEAPVETALWATATITIPNLLITSYYLYSAPEDEREEYVNFPEWVHAISTPFKAGGQWWYVPKPFAAGYVFGSMPQMFMIWMHKNDKPEAREFAMQLASGTYGAMTPWYDESSLIPTSVRVLVENTTNHNFFLGRDIFPSWLETALPSDQVNKYNTQTSRMLGSALDVSPAIIDNTLRGFLGGSARYVTDASDWIINDIRRARGEEVAEQPASVKNIPVVRSFAHRTPTGFRSESAQTFFDRWEEVSAVHVSFKKRTGEEKADFIEEYGDTIRKFKPMKSFYDRMRKMGKRADSVYSDTQMTPEEKAQELEEIDRQILDIATQANEWFKGADE